MIKLIFTINREIFRIRIDKQEIWYSDRKWNKEIRLIPKDERFLYKIRMSRNRIPNFLINLFELTAEEQKEYEENKDSEEKLAEICIKDIKKKGAQFLDMKKE
jgi:hypothetical protein